MNYKNEKLLEFNTFLKGKKVAIIGLGVSNIPLLEYMKVNNANVTVFDEKEENEANQEALEIVRKYNFQANLGKDSLQELKGFDIVFRSPSCLPTRKELLEEKARGAIITSEIEMLMKLAPCKIIGVTGSDGKTTTTSLIYSILKEAGYNVYLGGNIGVPLFTKLEDILPQDIIVLELSSFQLMGMELSPNIGVITNITPNHLNIHKDYNEYIEAKKNIFKYQTKDDIVILNYDNEITRKCVQEAHSKVELFSRNTKLDNGFIVDGNAIKECEDGIRKHVLDTSEVLLRGKHNYENMATALAATKTLVETEIAVQAIKKFKSVEHRLEFVREIDGCKWYNDSVSSSPTRTIAGLNSFDEDIVLIAGGYDKNLDYTPIAKPILDKVKTLILLGETSGKIFEAVKQEEEKSKKHIDIHMCETLQETINLAKRVAKPGEVVLFSPASASFDMFKNFADRGNQFKKLVNKL